MQIRRPNRAHPYRLPNEHYRQAGQIVFITVRTKSPAPLSVPHVSRQLVKAMGRIAATRAVNVNAHCIMPDHLHAVISLPEETGDVAGWVRFFKRDAARRLGQPGMWQRSFWDRSARLDDDIDAMVEYTLHNPVRAGWCEDWSQWPYSWCQWHPESRGPDPHAPGPWARPDA